jgi:quinol-cytochrome oxidoreductase complex cytochrome b subunit
MKLLSVLKKNAVVILFILAVLGLVLYMNYAPEGFQMNSSTPTTTTQYKPLITSLG